MFKTFLKRHEESQDRTKITAIPTTTYEILRNTTDYLNITKYNRLFNIRNITNTTEILRNTIDNLCVELKNLWNREYYSPHFESTLKMSSDSLNYIEGLDNYVKIIDKGQTGSTSFNLSKV